MFRLIHLLVLCFLLIGAPASPRAQELGQLFEDFDANALTQSEKRFLQAALAFEGHYVGMLDGAWGELSRQALSRYSRAEFGTSAENWHMAMLAYSFFTLVERDGWDYFYLEPAGISILWPFAAVVQDAASNGYQNYRHGKSSLGISIAFQDQVAAQHSHDYVQNRHELEGPAYSVRKNNLAISTSKKRDGSTLYARSDFVKGSWFTVLLSADRQDEGMLTAMAASIRKGRPVSLRVVQNGRLEQAIVQTADVLDRAAKEENEAALGKSQSEPDEGTSGPRKKSSGSGFFVASSGVLLTNSHVVEGCGSIFVDNLPASVIVASDEFDLALLNVEGASPKEVAVFSASSAKLNADVIAVGFPYGGLLGGLNVTRGSVSALKGLTGDLTRMQISAPIQSGNSGGPVLASDGEVIGVVVSKLDAIRVAEATGDTPQNVNFAVRGEIARLFLAQNGFEPLLSLEDSKLEPEALAEKAANFTAFVECR